ncbi:SGNH/GDSL hydrolase family protein [Paenibacillus durus]|uniref:GDSL family lipase n=1 Tax=Paenibacillus durus ATCC 35681 TaxID=1333534 RepID=A0A0F7CHG4_PAEDU|nr:SGNH/GDSL hydrolase family protein [Paenibacillus durus]AKG34441.1 GDSL family lipase [Paenibacillus durus ATCC 35681]
MLFKENDVILFQGDSITDVGRNRFDAYSLGNGYPLMVAGRLGLLFPEKKLAFYNRGVGGDRAADLVRRWDRDCLALKPTWVSIYVGINESWYRYDSGEETTPEAFEAQYRNLLDRTRQTLDAKLILIEPFVLPVQGLNRDWREDLDPKIAVVRKLAREYRALLVPLDGLFAAASIKADPAYWTEDGVHPTPAGHALITEAWLKAVGVN